jgi:hypothetical protein
MKDAYYFPHDCGARNDPKILQLRIKMGWEGYGLFFAFVEILREQKNYKYPSDAIATLELSLSIDKVTLDQFLDTCYALELLTKVDDFIVSSSLLSRMEIIDRKRRQRIEAGRKGGKAKAIKEKESKVKERKVKKRESKKDEIIQIKPDSVSVELWNDFISNRKFKGLQNTDRALNKIVKDMKVAVDKGFSFEECIEFYISRKTQTFKAEWLEEWSRSGSAKGQPEYLSEAGRQTAINAEAFVNGSYK